ncbi:MAG: FAD-dependent oxidoreductase [Proteobacteria bacterium]|nr:FAD-dependent oxidoreductase [Pseudomonadota bacterium]
METATLLEPERRIRLVSDYDVVVAGGGTAGVVAAVAARRNGARVLLLERGGFLGGHIASQLLEHRAGWFDAGGNRIVGGLADELVNLLVGNGASPGHIRDDTGYTRFRLPVNHEEFKSLVTRWIADSGVDFLLFSPVCAAAMEGSGLAAVIVENKSGRLAYRAKAFVDCTGDADVAHAVGCEMLSVGPGAATQPVSLLFKLGGVDHSRMIDYVEEHPEDFKMGVAPQALRGRAFINLWGFGSLLNRAYSEGVLSFERNELHHSGNCATGEAIINLTRYAADATEAQEMARAEVALRRQVLEALAFFRKYVPGCEKSFLAATAACVGVRESRRIAGVYELRDEDVRTGRQFDDAVATGGFPIDSHDPRGPSMDGTEQVRKAYQIPFRSLVPLARDGLIVAGRCISASRRALASARISGTCMAMGHAAGTAAALAAKSGKSLRSLDIQSLQATLRAQGAVI